MTSFSFVAIYKYEYEDEHSDHGQAWKGIRLGTMSAHTATDLTSIEHSGLKVKSLLLNTVQKACDIISNDLFHDI